jgi:phage replication O-like protein O
MSFAPPNYTQTPNDLFDHHMPDMSDAELRVVLAIVRLTFGYHKKRARASITKLQDITGLSRPAVIRGANKAVERGLLIKIKTKRVNEWVVNFDDYQETDSKRKLPEIVNESYQSSKQKLPPSIKENSKENSKEKEVPASPSYSYDADGHVLKDKSGKPLSASQAWIWVMETCTGLKFFLNKGQMSRDGKVWREQKEYTVADVHRCFRKPQVIARGIEGNWYTDERIWKSKGGQPPSLQDLRQYIAMLAAVHQPQEAESTPLPRLRRVEA